MAAAFHEFTRKTLLATSAFAAILLLLGADDTAAQRRRGDEMERVPVERPAEEGGRPDAPDVVVYATSYAPRGMFSRQFNGRYYWLPGPATSTQEVANE